MVIRMAYGGWGKHLLSTYCVQGIKDIKRDKNLNPGSHVVLKNHLKPKHTERLEHLGWESSLCCAGMEHSGKGR